MSYALLCLHMNRNQEIEAVTRKVLDLNPGEMLKATAYAALIEALRSQGKFREGNRIGELLLDEGSSNFTKSIAYYEMAYNLAEMEEDLDEALELRPPLGRAGAGRDQAVPARRPGLGALQAARSSTRRSTSSRGRASWGRRPPP